MFQEMKIMWVSLSGFFIIYVIICGVDPINCQIRNAIRMGPYNSTSDTGAVSFVNMSLVSSKTETKINAIAVTNKDIYIHMGKVEILRCNYDGYKCEYFQTWTFKKEVLLSTFNMKNQIWTPLFDSLQPRVTVPVMKKNTYTFRNAYLDPDAIEAFYPGAHNYHFKAKVGLLNQKQEIEFQLHLCFNIFQYRERKRS